jgi:ubiquinone/menaquinone biosynthesis C-methylase UbiE
LGWFGPDAQHPVQAQPAPRTTTDAGAAAQEGSVRPGVNQPYFEPDAARKWSRVLEAPSREIARRHEEIVAALQLPSGAAVADIGAGTGLLSLDLARAVGPTGKVFAVDIVPAFLAEVRGRAQRAGLTNVRTVLANERSADLPAASIDLAFLCDVYHHLEYPHTYLASLARALRPGGRLVVIDFKRIPGVTKPAVLDHVRADQAQVTREIEQAGFRLLTQRDLLVENYWLEFAATPAPR